MPLYEYYCTTCKSTTELLRPPAQADAPVVCPQCQTSSAQRILSLFASSVKSVDSSPVPAMSTGGGCCGGSCGCHAHG